MEYFNFRSISQLSELLASSNLEVRLSAGEALAVVFEIGREFHDDFAEDIISDLVETLRQLATDSHKYRAKKDRKQQRATFRDVLQFIEVNITMVKGLETCNLILNIFRTIVTQMCKLNLAKKFWY